jgi:thiosulfate reductase cytochrome b subunit
MNELFEWLVTVEDMRQPAKITHLLKAIIAIMFFVRLANANE